MSPPARPATAFPVLAAHADWSVDARKRWVSCARREPHGWVMAAPVPVGEVGSFLARLIAQMPGGAVMLGIDCPLGLPLAYAAQLRGVADFLAFLRGLPAQPEFFDVARTIDEVSLARPFFPAGRVSGAGHKLALARALNMENAGGLCRLADLRTAHRPGGGQLFWTLGANQCGKAALAAWRDLVIPGLAAGVLKLWPFEGEFGALAAPGQVVIAEAYPAEALRQLGLKLRGSKQSQASRKALADGIVSVMAGLGVRAEPALAAAIATGFGPAKDAEDPFDSLIGVLGVINVLAGNKPGTTPFAADRWQGWVLGQTDLPV